MGHVSLGVAVAAFVMGLAMGLIVALALIVFAHNHVSFGIVVAFVTGLVVAAFIGIIAVRHSRESAAA